MEYAFGVVLLACGLFSPVLRFVHLGPMRCQVPFTCVVVKSVGSMQQCLLSADQRTYAGFSRVQNC